MASSFPSAPAQTQKAQQSPERAAPRGAHSAAQARPGQPWEAALGLGWAESTGGALCAHTEASLGLLAASSPTMAKPRALWRDSRSLVALFEALRKLCNSLYLGCPGGTEDFGKKLAGGNRTTPHPQAYPSAVREQGQHAIRVQWHRSFSPRVRNSLSEISSLGWTRFL